MEKDQELEGTLGNARAIAAKKGKRVLEREWQSAGKKAEEKGRANA